MDAYQFFLKNAGFFYDPKCETPRQARMRNARVLAKAERAAREAGFSCSWSEDPDLDSSEWNDETPPWRVWQCVLSNADGKIVNSLHGIDFGRDGLPCDPCKRVLEARLAMKQFPASRSQSDPREDTARSVPRSAAAPVQSAAAPVLSRAPSSSAAGFDVEAFLRNAKRNFVRLQVANDAGDFGSVRELLTPELFELLKQAQRGPLAQQTDVISLDARALELAIDGDRQFADVQFSGVVREAPQAPATGFSEVWKLTTAVDSAGWQLAAIQ